jgi:dipeptidase
MLVRDHEKYHKMGAGDIKWSGNKVGQIEFLRPTSGDGEQCSVACEIFHDDTREDITKRFNWLFSIVQDRLEDQNRAVHEAKSRYLDKVEERFKAQVKEYTDKGQKPPKKMLEGLESVALQRADLEEVLGDTANEG